MTAADDLLAPPEGDHPTGTVQQNSQGSPWFWVRGSDCWHLVNADTGECTCAHWRFRCARDRAACKHVSRIARHLHDCPACHGQGQVVPSGLIHYVTLAGDPDPGPWDCSLCSGSGNRS